MAVEKILNSLMAQKELERLRRYVQRMRELQENYVKCTDVELKSSFIQLKRKSSFDENVRCHVFALVKEAVQRVFQIELHPEQVMAGWVLADGKIAEMATGEGKTLMSVLPACWYTVLGKKVHMMTVNEYLAKRDFEEMGKVFRLLGVTVGLNLAKMTGTEKKHAYQQDVTYGVCSEFGFDYLKDHLVRQKTGIVQPPLDVVIVDEIDSILIDEAKTPLIISEKQKTPPDVYGVCYKLVSAMQEGRDYEIDLQTNQVLFTEPSIRRLEAVLMIENLYDGEHAHLFHFLLQCLRANVLMKKDDHYMVKDGEVQLIDAFTGRVLAGRQYNDGLHQAIEAKEGLPLSEENRVKATITIQKLFSLYETVVGMTGTIQTEEKEIYELYGIEAATIPTHKPVIREDLADVIFSSRQEKEEAIIAETKSSFQRGQPVLVGTTSVAQSEHLARLLQTETIPFQLLNAKTETEEAEMIARAGEKGMITIATNMAGRGTDIRLGEGVATLGGLYVIGTEKHESRRIDRQLRGRAGRQGDPGRSRFFLSLEDELIVRFAGERLERWRNAPLKKEWFETVQYEVEQQNYAIRTIVYLLDSVVHDQRTLFYHHRQNMLEAESFLETLQQHVSAHVKTMYKTAAADEDHEEKEVEQQILLDWQQRINELTALQRQQLLQAYMTMMDEGWANHLQTLHHLKQSLHARIYEQRDPILIFHDEAWKLYTSMEYHVRETLVHALKEMLSSNFKEDVPALLS
jgi:preprotein translocase subunit SecA